MQRAAEVSILTTKPSLSDSSGTIQTITAWNNQFHAFPKDIILKVNEKAQLEFELVLYDMTFQHVTYSTTGNPPLKCLGMYLFTAIDRQVEFLSMISFLFFFLHLIFFLFSYLFL